MQGTIEAAKKSKSGKTLGLKIDGTWYITKEWELEGCVNQMISFIPAIDTYMEKEQRWINEYELIGGAAPEGGVPGVAAPPAPSPTAASTRREHNRGRPDANDTAVENQLLLRFVGHGLSARVDQSESVEGLAKVLYKIGKDILSGRFDAITTADSPREPGEDDDGPPY